ncbi:hypothetical protein HZS_2627 [Henneguya salminicola]|nr:hypothetical protein HZS_2627 [Henneguya salminicola]
MIEIEKLLAHIVILSRMPINILILLFAKQILKIRQNSGIRQSVKLNSDQQHFFKNFSKKLVETHSFICIKIPYKSK